MSSPNPNSNIPAEILIKVFCEVDYIGIVKCRAVCRFWASVISSSATLQYLVWMEITQKADGNSSCSPRASADRLKLLLDHEFSWSSLRPQCYRRHEVPFGIKAYISGQDSATIRHDITAGPDETSQMLFLHHLDSTLGSSEEVSKPIRSPIHAFGVTNEGWTVDVDNELVVIASSPSEIAGGNPLRIQLRSLKDPSHNHPLAQQPTIEIENLFEEIRGSYSYAKRAQFTAGPNLILQYSSVTIGGASIQSASIILVINWITGQIVSRLCLPFTSRASYDVQKLCLLSPTSFVIPELRYLDSSNEKHQISCSLHVYDFSKPSGADALGCAVPTLTGIFALPTFPDQSSNLGFARAECSCSNPASPKLQKSSKESKPFILRDEARILTTKLVSPTKKGIGQPCVFVSQVDTLLASQSPLSVNNSITPTPWADWSETSTTSIPTVPRFSVLATCGERLAIISYPDGLPSKPSGTGWTLEVLDFNPVRIRRFATPQKGDPLAPTESSRRRPSLECGTDHASPPSAWPSLRTELGNAVSSHIEPPPHPDMTTTSSVPKDKPAADVGYLRTVRHLSGNRPRHGVGKVGLCMDAERIILTMPQVVCSSGCSKDDGDDGFKATLRLDSDSRCDGSADKEKLAMMMEVWTF